MKKVLAWTHYSTIQPGSWDHGPAGIESKIMPIHISTMEAHAPNSKVLWEQKDELQFFCQISKIPIDEYKNTFGS